MAKMNGHLSIKMKMHLRPSFKVIIYLNATKCRHCGWLQQEISRIIQEVALPLVSLSQKGREIQNMTVFEKVLSTCHRFVLFLKNKCYRRTNSCWGRDGWENLNPGVWLELCPVEEWHGGNVGAHICLESQVSCWTPGRDHDKDK